MDFDWGGLLGGLAQGGVAWKGYDTLTNDLENTRGNLFNQGGTFDQVRGDVGNQGAFTGYGVRSALGNSGYNPATGQMDYNLSQGQQGQMDALGNMSQQMYNQSMDMNPQLAGQATGNFGAADDFRNRSMMDTGAREGDIYNRIRQMQMPEETRQYESMNAGLFGSGRGGMQTDAYGGSPEQMAFGKAQSEARNAASYQAINQAQQEMMNYGNMANMYGQQGTGQLGQGAQMQQLYNQMGQGMQAGQYMPLQQMMGLNQQGLAGSQMQNQSGQAMAGLLAQLGLGEATTQVNLDNVKGTAFAGLMEALGLAAGGVGQAAGDLIP